MASVKIGPYGVIGPAGSILKGARNSDATAWCGAVSVWLWFSHSWDPNKESDQWLSVRGQSTQAPSVYFTHWGPCCCFIKYLNPYFEIKQLDSEMKFAPCVSQPHHDIQSKIIYNSK